MSAYIYSQKTLRHGSVEETKFSALKLFTHNFKARDAIDLVSWSHASEITLVIHTILLINENKEFFFYKIQG